MEQCTRHKEVPGYGASYESDIILPSFFTVFGHGAAPRMVLQSELLLRRVTGLYVILSPVRVRLGKTYSGSGYSPVMRASVP